MRYLIDSNVFFHFIGDDIIGVASSCKKDNCGMYISPKILQELRPPEKSEYSKEYYNLVNNCLDGALCKEKYIQMVDVSKEAIREYNKIRAKYYRWTADPAYLQRMIDEQKLTREEAKKIRHKDVGECELLAIAKTSEKQHNIVTEDGGKVFKHPNMNIYQYYENDDKIKIVKPVAWLSEINYSTADL